MSKARMLSIVVPAYNEAESLPLLVDAIVPVLDALPDWAWELILVDDGSTDGSAEFMRELAARRAGVRAVLLRSNFGKSAGLMAGFREARGEVVITMDADLQDDPQEIPAFLETIDEGYDLVSGWKKERNDPLEKRLASRFFNAVVRKVSGVKLHDNNCGFKAYRRWCIKAIELKGNQHRFVAAILAWRGAKIAEIPVRHHRRQFGTSKYGIARYFDGAFDLMTLLLLTKFSQKPLYFFALVGMPFVMLGGLIVAYLLVNHILYKLTGTIGFEMTARPLLIIAVFLLLGGMLIWLIGLLAELVLRSTTLDKGYWVKDVVDASSARPPTAGSLAEPAPDAHRSTDEEIRGKAPPAEVVRR
jgi:glycosyltransferase involved in cell wall biosynthesis